MRNIEIYNLRTKCWVDTEWKNFKQIKESYNIKKEYTYFVSTNSLTSTPIIYRKKLEEAGLLIPQEKTYSVGQRFKHNEDEYILARCDTEISGSNLCALINLRDGNTWAFAHQVKSLSKITEIEFGKIVGINNKIKEFKEILNE